MANITTSRCFKSLLLTVVSMTIGTTFFNVKSAQSYSLDDTETGASVGFYADEVVKYERGYSNNWNKFFGEANAKDPRWGVDNPLAALGSPKWTSEMTGNGELGQWDNKIGTSLGEKGSLTVKFTDNVLTGSGDDQPDLWIFEIGGIAEKVFVEISTDNKTWHDVGKADRKDKTYAFGVGIDIDSVLDQKEIASNTLFPFVRVTDTGDNKYNNFKAGADIDAIKAVSSQSIVSESVPEPSFIIGLLSLGIVSISTLIRPLQKCRSWNNDIRV